MFPGIVAGQLIRQVPIASEGPTYTYSIELYDSYGDGWNGNSLYLTINRGKIIHEDITIADGSESTYTFEAKQGDVIEARWRVGRYSDEVSFVLKLDDQVIVEYPLGSLFNHPNNALLFTIIAPTKLL